MSWKRQLSIPVALFLLCLLVVSLLLAWDWNTPHGKRGETVAVVIPRGTQAGRAIDLLDDQGLFRSRVSFKLLFTLFGKARNLRAGTYSFTLPVTPFEVLDRLNSGHLTLTKVTIPEGLTIEETARVLAAAHLGSEGAFLAAEKDPTPIADLDPNAEDLEGYLYPETYLVDKGLSEKTIVDILVKSLRAWWRSARVDAPGDRLRDIVILASLVEKETGNSGERSLIAGVFYNRLKIGMPLQTDPTIIYAERKRGLYGGRLLKADLAFQSPYNTYLHAGLPPGPICSPGKASLDAALHPVSSGYLYFVSRGNGTHAFSKTLREHNRWVSKYRWKEKRRSAR